LLPLKIASVGTAPRNPALPHQRLKSRFTLLAPRRRRRSDVFQQSRVSRFCRSGSTPGVRTVDYGHCNRRACRRQERAAAQAQL